MFRPSGLITAIFFTVAAVVPAWGATDRHERVALLVSDPHSPPGTCKLESIAPALRDLRFIVHTRASDADTEWLNEFATLSSTADAAMIFACNPRDRSALPAVLKASKLNFLFLLETRPGKRSATFDQLLKTDRDDLMIVHVRLDKPENEEIFSRTLTHKLRRPYSLPADILSRTVVSSYYRSRGSMLIELQGRISSGYILAKPPTEKILDAWSRVQKSTDRKALEAFIAKFPKTLFADLARSRLEKLP